MRLIVNADDLGTNEIINDEIFALIKAGRVTSATMIANAPAFQHAARRSLEFPDCSFGVHLNLTVFRPLSSTGDLEPILENGELSQKLFSTTVTARLREACLIELTAQVQRVLDAGVHVSHFDSHEHIHTIPRLFPVIKKLQRQFGIRKVRSTINLLPAGKRMDPVRSLKKGLFNFALRNIYSTSCPQGLGDFRDLYDALSSGAVPRFSTLEVMVHPGTTNPNYNEEVDLLRSDWPKSLQPDTRLVSYHQL
jgi:predicted glycoside hydrolase/deacetylase ChbG (UPF0249 family)